MASPSCGSRTRPTSTPIRPRLPPGGCGTTAQPSSAAKSTLWPRKRSSSRNPAGLIKALLLQELWPVDNHGDGRVRIVGQALVEHEALAVRGHVILTQVRVEIVQARLEQRLGSAR